MKQSIHQVMDDILRSASKKDKSKIQSTLQDLSRARVTLKAFPNSWHYNIIMSNFKDRVKILKFDDSTIRTFLMNKIKTSLKICLSV